MNGQERQIIQEAEHLLQGVASHILDPIFRECMLCFTHRQNSEYGCDGTLRFALHFRDRRVPRATALRSRLWKMNSRCDCGVLSRSYMPTERLTEELNERYGAENGPWSVSIRTCAGPARPVVTDRADEAPWQEEPAEADRHVVDPVCLGVRAGSARPCELWQPLPSWLLPYLYRGSAQ